MIGRPWTQTEHGRSQSDGCAVRPLTSVPGMTADPMAPADPSSDRAGPGAAIRVIVADDSYFVRETLVHVLEGADGIEVIACCSDLESLQQAIERDRPDVVVTDIRMPPSQTDEGIQVAAALHETHPQIGVVLLSQYTTRGTGWRCWRAARTAARTC